jgi:hypothetical protein
MAALFADVPILRWMSPRLASVVGEASTLTRVFWHVWLEPLALYLVALLVLLSLAVAAALSLVNRLTLERA